MAILLIFFKGGFKLLQINDTHIKNVLENLNKHGDSAIYGGFLRDTLLSINPKDVDIVTTISASQFSELYPYASSRQTLTGINVFSFNYAKKQFEVTTDADDIYDKSKNADLNINSLIYFKNQLIDVNDSLNDFQLKLIKSVGNNFSSIVNVTPFRWLKPIVLSATTGFDIDKLLVKSLLNTIDSYKLINDNILTQEGYRILESSHPHLALKYLSKMGTISEFHLNKENEIVELLNKIKNYELRLVLLSTLLSRETILDFIHFFKFPAFLTEKYNELLSIIDGKETQNFKLINQKILLDRLLKKNKKC